MRSYQDAIQLMLCVNTENLPAKRLYAPHRTRPRSAQSVSKR
jgi:hypothetical protein